MFTELEGDKRLLSEQPLPRSARQAPGAPRWKSPQPLPARTLEQRGRGAERRDARTGSRLGQRPQPPHGTVGRGGLTRGLYAGLLSRAGPAPRGWPGSVAARGLCWLRGPRLTLQGAKELCQRPRVGSGLLAAAGHTVGAFSLDPRASPRTEPAAREGE